MPSLWISNARVIDPATKRDAVGDLFIKDGKFVASLSAAELKKATETFKPVLEKSEQG
jgi:dihydroorotase